MLRNLFGIIQTFLTDRLSQLSNTAPETTAGCNQERPNGGGLTAVVETVELAEVAGAEAHPLANHVQEVRDLGDDGGFRAGVEGRFAVVHDGAVVVGNAQSTGRRVLTGFEVVLLPWQYHRRRREGAQSSFRSGTDWTSRVSLSIDLPGSIWSHMIWT